MQTYIVLILVFLMLFLLLRGFRSSMISSPKKIKALTFGIFITLFFRYITLGVLTIVQNPMFLYLLKPLFFINLISIPCIFMVCYYIFSRNSKIPFNVFFIFSGILIALYGMLIILQPCSLVLNEGILYTFIFKNSNKIFLPFIIFNMLTVLLSLKLLNNPRSNKIGTYLMTISGLLTFIELFTSIININLLPVNMVGDIIWTLTLNYSIDRAKKSPLASNATNKVV